MELSEFEEVHPNWSIIASMNREQLEALVDLTVTLLALDDTVPPEKHSAIVHAIFDGCDEGLDSETIQRLDWDAEERLATTESGELSKHLVAAAKTIESEDERIATLRLLAIVAFSSKPTTEEVEYLQVVGDAMGFDDDFVEDVMRAAWETRQGPVSTRLRERTERHVADGSANFVWGQKY